MALRIHHLHPSLAHFPLTLLPASLALDLIGRASGSEPLMAVARHLMPLAAGSAVATGVAGLVAQEAVRTTGRAHDVLVTHRNLNLGLIGLTAALAAWRGKRLRPSAGYLLTGLAGVAAMNYTAYLGGEMVYVHGVGVESANGLKKSEAPEIRRGQLATVLRMSAAHAMHALQHAMRHLMDGEIAPFLRRRSDGRQL